MNILFVIPSLGVGGAQSFLLRMLSAFPKEHNIYLYDVHPKQKENEIISNLTNEIVIYSSLYERLEIFLSNWPKVITKILNRLDRHFSLRDLTDKIYFNRILRKKKIQIINSHMYLADSFVYNNSKYRIPKISSFHGCYNLIWKKNRNDNNFEQLKIQIREILNNYSGVITAATKHNDVFENFGIKKLDRISKIYYGFEEQKINKLDIRLKFSIPHDSFIFGMVARGDITKGWQEAIDAFLRLKDSNENIFLILCGGTEYLKGLKEEYKSNNHIIFTGNISEPLSYIDNFNAGLLPTYFPAESLPNTVIEYLYSEKPVIATDWAEISKMIDYNGEKAGEIISIKNGKADVEELFSAMKSYVHDSGKVNRHSVLAKKAFTKFEMQKCIQSYINFFETSFENK